MKWMDSTRFFLACAVCLAAGSSPLYGCTGAGASPTSAGPVGDDEPGFIIGYERPCVRPGPGCACDIGAPPVRCDLPTTQTVEGRTLCHVGALYCHDGAFTECQDIRTYSLEDLSHATNDPLGACPAAECNPDCSLARDRPTDLSQDGESDGDVVYDPDRGGITLDGEGGGVVTRFDDTDGDGVPDVVDDCPATPGLAEFFGCTTGATPGIFHALAPGDTADPDELDIEVDLVTADFYILMDSTGSMGGEIDAVQASLTSGDLRLPENRADGEFPCPEGADTGILGAIRCKIPNVHLGVGTYREFGPSYGGGDDIYFHHYVDLTDDVSLLQLGVNSLETNGNIDWPEAGASALYSVVTGRGIGDYVPNRTGCAAGHWGYPCFRPNSLPVVVLFTDANMHNGPSRSELTSLSNAISGSEDYDDWAPVPGRTLPPTRGTALGNDTFSTARDLGTIGDESFSIMGSTESLSNQVHRFEQNCYDVQVTDYVCDIWLPVLGCISGHYETWTETRCDPATLECEGYAPDAVFRFEVDRERELTFTTDGSSYDTRLSVRAADESLLHCSDDAPFEVINYTLLSAVTGTFQPGVTYYVVVDGFDGANGSYRLHVRSQSDGPDAMTTSFPLDWETDVEPHVVSSGMRALSVMSCSSDPTIDTHRDSRGYCQYAFDDVRQLARDTDSLDPAGDAYLAQIRPDGTGLDEAFVETVAYFADTTRMDVTLVPRATPATVLPSGLVLEDLLAQVLPTSCPATCLGGASAGTCFDCVAGTEGLGFSVRFSLPGTVVLTTEPQVIEFDLVAVGNGSIDLGTTPVRIAIPPIGGDGPPGPMAGRYSNEYDAADRCDFSLGARPDWGQFDWSMADLPPDTRVTFDICSAESPTAMGCTGARIVIPADTTADGGPIDLATALSQSGVSIGQRYLRVTATLESNDDGLSVPVLEGWDVQLTCVAFE